MDWIPFKRLVEVYREIQKVIRTEPSPKERKLMIGIMLDGLGIRAGDDTDGYIEALSFEMAEIYPPDYHRDLLDTGAGDRARYP